MVFKKFGINTTKDFIVIFEPETKNPQFEEIQYVYSEVSLKVYIKNTQKGELTHDLFVHVLTSLKKYKEVGCEKCKRSCVQCSKLPDFDKMLFNSENYKSEWDLVKKGAKFSCGFCKEVDTCGGCPCSFISEYNQDNSARLCFQFVEEMEPRKVLENIEKGMNKIDSVMALTSGNYPEGV